MSEKIEGQAIIEAMQRACQALQDQSEHLTELDQAVGDGDTGLSMASLGKALSQYAAATPLTDVGKFLGGAGMAANKAAPSTLGTLMAMALLRAGKLVTGQPEITPKDLAAMLAAASQGIQERGKAKPGDKTIVDALTPASEAFTRAVQQGTSLPEAGRLALEAAIAGRDSVTPLRSRIGRAGWVGERTEGQVDPGCEALVIILRAITAD